MNKLRSLISINNKKEPNRNHAAEEHSDGTENSIKNFNSRLNCEEESADLIVGHLEFVEEEKE